MDLNIRGWMLNCDYNLKKDHKYLISNIFNDYIGNLVFNSKNKLKQIRLLTPTDNQKPLFETSQLKNNVNVYFICRFGQSIFFLILMKMI